MPKSILVHGLWSLAAATSFVLGSQFFAAERTNRDPTGAAGSEGKKRVMSGRGSDGSNGSGDATRGGAKRPGAGTYAARERIVLTEEEIESLGSQFKGSSNPIERRLAFSKLLEALTVENAQQIREQIAHMPQDSSEFREFHYAWGSIAGEKAVLNGKDTPKRDMAATFAGWASADPAAARSWYDNLPESGFDRNGLKWGAVYGMADADPNVAMQFVSHLRESGEKDGERMMHVVTSAVLRAGDPEEAARWVDGLADEDLRIFARDRVASDFVSRDAEAAGEWASQYNDQPGGSRLINHVSRDWARRDPEAAVGWLESLGSSDGRIEGYGSAFGAWAGRNPEAAGTYLTDMPRSPERDAALGGFANRIVHEDPGTAISWANAIADPGRREETLTSVARQYFRRDRAGATEWLPTSGLSVEAQQQVMRGGRR